MKRMHDELELRNVAKDEVGKLDKLIPTSISGDGDEVRLEHDTLPLGEPVHFKQLFGKHSLIGEGNVDLYNHFILVTNTDGSKAIVMHLTLSNGLMADSITDLDTLIGTNRKYIDVSGGYIVWLGK